MTPTSSSGRDYRDSHLERGPTYDESLRRGAMDSYFARREAAEVTNWVRELFPNGVDRYLDFACGTGRLVEVVGALARETIGVDISESMLAEARRKFSHYSFVLGDLTRDDLKLGQFDLVTAFRFFGNAQDDLREAALQAIHRSLRPGGYLILDNHRNPYTLNRIGRSMFAGDRLVATDQWARADLHYRKLRTLLAAHGFEIQRTKGFAWWVVLARLGQEKFFTSDWAQALERLGAIRAVAALSPAYVVAARKV